MGYDIEKEKREAIEAGQRALSSLRTAKENLNSAKNWDWWICLAVDSFLDVETLQDGSGQTKYGTGEI